MMRIYRRLQKALVPELQYSQIQYRNVLDRMVSPTSCWLDVGCGHRLFEEWMAADELSLLARCSRVAGIDADFPSLQAHKTIHSLAMADSAALPFRDEAFNLVTANMVVEHLPKPELVLAEVLRVLRPGGYFVFHTPNRRSLPIRIAAHVPDIVKRPVTRTLEGRKDEDIFPTRYLLNTSDRIAKVAGACGFQVKEIRLINSSAITAMLGPLSIFELLYLRLLTLEQFKNLRTNIIATLQK